jgi:hypothetical protein
MQQIPRELVADLVRGGAVVLICQPCLEEFGLRLDDIVPGCSSAGRDISRISSSPTMCAH